MDTDGKLKYVKFKAKQFFYNKWLSNSVILLQGWVSYE